MMVSKVIKPQQERQPAQHEVAGIPYRFRANKY
jgi:hypothetical protein